MSDNRQFRDYGTFYSCEDILNKNEVYSTTSCIIYRIEPDTRDIIFYRVASFYEIDKLEEAMVKDSLGMNDYAGVYRLGHKFKWDY